MNRFGKDNVIEMEIPTSIYVPVLPAHDVMTAPREIEGTFQIL